MADVMGDQASPAPQYQFAWTQISTIAGLAGVVAVILTVFTLLIDRIRRGRAADPHHFMTRKDDMGYFWIAPLNWWKAFWKRPTQVPKLPSVGGLIEAGDLNLWSSAAIDQLEPHHGEISWEPIYSAIYSQIAMESGSMINWDEAVVEDAKKFYDRALHDDLGKKPGGKRRNLVREGILIPCIRLLDEVANEPKNPINQISSSPINSRQISMSWSVSRTLPNESTYTLQHVAKSLRNTQFVWMRYAKPCIEISREELLALSLTLGITLYINDFTQNIRGLGPFGTGLDVIQDNGEWRLEIVQGARLGRHSASRGSGYTTLFAKHIAFGSLPFADTTDWTRSVYINEEVLEVIKRGRSVVDGFSFGGRPLQILRRLPASKQIDAYYHCTKIDVPLDDPSFGRFYKTDQKTPIEVRQRRHTSMSHQKSIYANWSRAVTGIAFGGLVPQSSPRLATAVDFTVNNFGAAGYTTSTVEDLTNKVEELVNKIQAWDCRDLLDQKRGLDNSEDDLEDIEMAFGDYVTQRAPSEENVDNVYYAIPIQYNDTQEAAASFARYMNVLERMVALFQSTSLPIPQNTTQQTRTANKPPRMSRISSIFGKENGNEDSTGIEMQSPKICTAVSLVFEASCEYIQSSYVEAVTRHRQESDNARADGQCKSRLTVLPVQARDTQHDLSSIPAQPIKNRSAMAQEDSEEAKPSLSQQVQLISDKVSTASAEYKDSIGAQSTVHPGAKSRLSITLPDCTLIVRCILVMWANQVPKILNTDIRETLSGMDESPKTNRPASLMELPPVMAFA